MERIQWQNKQQERLVDELRRLRSQSEQLLADKQTLAQRVGSLQAGKNELLNKVARYQLELSRQTEAVRRSTVNQSIINFLETCDASALEEEIQNPRELIMALKKACKFRHDQYQKVVKEKTRLKEMLNNKQSQTPQQVGNSARMAKNKARSVGPMTFEGKRAYPSFGTGLQPPVETKKRKVAFNRISKKYFRSSSQLLIAQNQILRFSHQHLKKIYHNRGWKRLETMRMTGNTLNKVDLRYHFRLLCHLRKLQDFSARLQLSTTSQLNSADNFLHSLKKCKSLELLHLDLSLSQIITKKEIFKLMGCLQSLNKLSKLVLNIKASSSKILLRSPLSKKDGEYFASRIRRLTNLRVLVLLFADVKDLKDSTIHQLMLGVQKLVKLVTFRIGVEGCSELRSKSLHSTVTALAELRSLTDFALIMPYAHRFEKRHFQDLCLHLYQLRRLFDLHLNFEMNEMIQDDKIDILAEALQDSRTLRSLKLNFSLCNLTNSSLYCLAGLFRTLRVVRKLELHLEFCPHITTLAVFHLCYSVKDLRYIREVNVNFTGCRRVDAEEICDKLMKVACGNLTFVSGLKKVPESPRKWNIPRINQLIAL